MFSGECVQVLFRQDICTIQGHGSALVAWAASLHNTIKQKGQYSNPYLIIFTLPVTALLQWLQSGMWSPQGLFDMILLMCTGKLYSFRSGVLNRGCRCNYTTFVAPLTHP